MTAAIVAGACAALGVALMLPVRAIGSGRRPRLPGRVLVALPVLLVPWAPSWGVPAVVVGLGAYAGWRLWRAGQASRRADETAEQVVAACEGITGDLRAGRPPAAALARAAQDWPALESVVSAQRLGAPVPVALRSQADRPGAGDLRLVAGAWEVSHRTGHGLAAALDRVRHTVRADRATTRVVAAELASARATARLVACLPLLSLLMGSGAGGDPVGFLLHTVAGWCCLAGGLALGLGGLAWIEAIARGVHEGER